MVFTKESVALSWVAYSLANFFKNFNTFLKNFSVFLKIFLVFPKK
jgi:hypothetical protein